MVLVSCLWARTFLCISGKFDDDLSDDAIHVLIQALHHYECSSQGTYTVSAPEPAKARLITCFDSIIYCQRLSLNRNEDQEMAQLIESTHAYSSAPVVNFYHI